MIETSFDRMVVFIIGCFVGYGIYSFQRWLKVVEKGKHHKP